MIELSIFGSMLLGVALFHQKSTLIAVIGFLVLLSYKIAFISSFSTLHHLADEWHGLVNLVGLLFGFSILSKHFEESHIPAKIGNLLPTNWLGSFLLLALIFLMSGILDNIASAIIGGSIALVIYRGKVHLGYLTAIIAASNAGGAGSVLGDTTTTLMWISGISQMQVGHAYIASTAAFFVFATMASIQQDGFQKIVKENKDSTHIDYKKITATALILILTVLFNWLFDFPALGVWVGIIIGMFFCTTPWHELTKAISGTTFLTALVASASLIPVDKLPPASWGSTFVMGFVSAVFDNIPLTKICIAQGGYDWGLLAYAVGFGGSMIWFGSSSGVALSGLFPQIRSTKDYIKNGWYIIPAYIFGFFVLYKILGWNP